MNEDYVYMVTQLDSEYGYAVNRRVFIVGALNNSAKIITKIFSDKSVKGMLTTGKEVLYS